MMRVGALYEGEVCSAYYNPMRSLPDCFGKTGGYRVHPPACGGAPAAAGDPADHDGCGVFYTDIADVARHLEANPDWGVEVDIGSGWPKLLYHNILLRGVPR